MSEKSINSDLIRGNINTIILKALFDKDRYGYDIIKEIEVKSRGQYILKQPTLYSCLKRLETQGFIRAYWGTDHSNGGRRKYYTLTEMGRAVFAQNQDEYEYSRTIIDQLISDRPFDLSALPAVSYDDDAALDGGRTQDNDDDGDEMQDEQEIAESDEVATVATNENESDDSDILDETSENDDNTDDDATDDDATDDDDADDDDADDDDADEIIENSDNDDEPDSLSQDDSDDNIDSNESDEDEVETVSDTENDDDSYGDESDENEDDENDEVYGYIDEDDDIVPLTANQDDDEFEHQYDGNEDDDEFDDRTEDEQDTYNTAAAIDLAETEALFADENENDEAAATHEPETFPEELPRDYLESLLEKSGMASYADERDKIKEGAASYVFTPPPEYDRFEYDREPEPDKNDEIGSALESFLQSDGEQYRNDEPQPTEAEPVPPPVQDTPPTAPPLVFDTMSPDQQERDYGFLSYHSAPPPKQDKGESVFDKDYQKILETIAADNLAEPPPTKPDESYKNAGTSLKEKIQTRNFGKLTENIRDMGESAKIRTPNTQSLKEYNKQYYYKSNRLMLAQFAIVFALMLIESFVCYVTIRNGAGYKADHDILFYVLSIVAAVLLPVVAAIMFWHNPDKRKRYDFDFKTTMIYKLIIMAISMLLAYAFNVSLGMPLSTNEEFLFSLIMPLVLLTNLPVSTLIFNVLYKSGRFTADN